jgi:pimeloyl-ACP methyl ester carboxylesterase
VTEAALQEIELSRQAQVLPLTSIRPHPEHEGVFIFERGDIATHISQGVVHIGGAAIKYTLEEPLEIEDPTPMLLVPGYGGIKPAYKELRGAVAQLGKPAVTFRAPRTQKRFATYHPKHLLHPERLLTQSVIGITKNVIDRWGEKRGFTQLDIAGHSMGGPAIVGAGIIHPELFQTATAVASAGLDGHNMFVLAGRVKGVVTEELAPLIKDVRVARDYKTVLHMAHYIGRNPWRTTTEGLAVANCNIREEVVTLGNLGVKTAALQFASDQFFPLDGVVAHSGDRFDHFREFPDSQANHMWPMIDPEGVAEELVSIVALLKKLPSSEVATVGLKVA